MVNVGNDRKVTYVLHGIPFFQRYAGNKCNESANERQNNPLFYRNRAKAGGLRAPAFSGFNVALAVPAGPAELAQRSAHLSGE